MYAFKQLMNVMTFFMVLYCIPNTSQGIGINYALIMCNERWNSLLSCHCGGVTKDQGSLLAQNKLINALATTIDTLYSQYTALLWQKEASDKSDISCKRANV